MSSLRRALKLSIEESHARNNDCSKIDSRRVEKSNTVKNKKAKATSSAEKKQDKKSRKNNRGTKFSEQDALMCQPRSVNDGMDLAIAICSVTRGSNPTAANSERQHEDNLKSPKINDGAKISDHDESINSSINSTTARSVSDPITASSAICHPTEDDMDSEDEDEFGAFIYKSSQSQEGAASVSTIETRRTIPRHLNRRDSNPLQRLRNMKAAQKRPHPSEDTNPKKSATGSVSPTLRGAGGSIKVSQKRQKWTLEEDIEFFKRVRKHGKGSWKEILDDSPLLQERCKAAQSVEHTRTCLRKRWPITLEKMRELYDDAQLDDLIAPFANPDGIHESMDSGSESDEEGNTQDAHRLRGGGSMEVSQKRQDTAPRKKCARTTHPVADSSTVPNVGGVGYTFRKQFEGCGWYTGKVVKIRPFGGEHGGDRRCVYEDGDSEDLTLTTLQNLALLDPDNNTLNKLSNIEQRGCGSEQKTSRKERKTKTKFNLRPVLSRAKCQKELESGRETHKSHDGVCPRDGTYNFHQVSLSKAAASGCRKCRTELDSGEKTYKRHDGSCPRKWKISRGSYETRDDDSVEEIQESDRDLAKAAAYGCRKCQKQLDCGEKLVREDIHKPHDEGCPRKGRGWYQEDFVSELSRKNMMWTLEEDIEFAKYVRLHGEGKWQRILGSSPMLRERYKAAPSERHARDSLRTRWPKTLKRTKAWNDDDFSELFAIFMNRKRHQTSPEGTAANKCARVKRSITARPTRSVPNVGDVGYTFRKHFDGYGWYTGKVVKIIGLGADDGGDRRCEYDDGDSECLNLTQLQALARLDPENKRVHETKAHTLAKGRDHKAMTSSKKNVSDKCSATNCMSIHDAGDFHDRTARRSMRKTSTPDHFVARPTHQISPEGSVSLTSREVGTNMIIARKRQHQSSPESTAPQTVTESKNTVPNVGDVGYTFRKQFEGYGWYTGKVVKIRPFGGEHGGDRRCVYEDGDSEDLTLTTLQALALLDPDNNTLNKPSNIEPQKTSCKECKTKTKSNPHPQPLSRAALSLSRAAASGCRKCQKELESGRKPHISHDGGCPRKGTYKMTWTLEDDMELVKCVRLHGEGQWKCILDSSPILQERYKTAPSAENAQVCLRMRWIRSRKTTQPRMLGNVSKIGGSTYT